MENFTNNVRFGYYASHKRALRIFILKNSSTYTKQKRKHLENQLNAWKKQIFEWTMIQSSLMHVKYLDIEVTYLPWKCAELLDQGFENRNHIEIVDTQAMIG